MAARRLRWIKRSSDRPAGEAALSYADRAEAASLGTFCNRPVVEDQVGEALSTVSPSADRRARNAQLDAFRAGHHKRRIGNV